MKASKLFVKGMTLFMAAGLTFGMPSLSAHAADEDAIEQIVEDSHEDSSSETSESHEENNESSSESESAGPQESHEASEAVDEPQDVEVSEPAISGVPEDVIDDVVIEPVQPVIPDSVDSNGNGCQDAEDRGSDVWTDGSAIYIGDNGEKSWIDIDISDDDDFEEPKPEEPEKPQPEEPDAPKPETPQPENPTPETPDKPQPQEPDAPKPEEPKEEPKPEQPKPSTPSTPSTPEHHDDIPSTPTTPVIPTTPVVPETPVEVEIEETVPETPAEVEAPEVVIPETPVEVDRANGNPITADDSMMSVHALIMILSLVAAIAWAAKSIYEVKTSDADNDEKNYKFSLVGAVAPAYATVFAGMGFCLLGVYHLMNGQLNPADFIGMFSMAAVMGLCAANISRCSNLRRQNK